MNTRYESNASGLFNNISDKVTSKVGAVTGCVGGKNNNIDRDGQSGGAYFGFSGSDVHSGGPTGGLPTLSRGQDCGVARESGLGAGKQHTYLQEGGNYGYVNPGIARYGIDTESIQNGSGDFRGSYAPIKSVSSCMSGGGGGIFSDIKRIKNFKQVEPFWHSMSKQSVKLYKTHLKKMEKTHPEKVLEIVKEYTTAFTEALIIALSKTKKHRNEKMKKSYASLRKAKNMLKKMNINALKIHDSIEKEIEKKINEFLEANPVIQKLSKNGGVRKHKKTRKHKKGGSRKNGKRVKRRTMKGGYHQFGSNTPNTPAYAVSTDGGWKMGTPGVLMNKNCDNCVDNYNHYSGKGSETGVFDQDVKA